MKPNKKFVVGLLMCVLLLGIATVVKADPPKPNNVAPTPVITPPPKGSFEPVPIHPVTDVLDPTTATITRLELSEDNKTLVPAAPAVVVPPEQAAFGAGSVRLDPENGITTKILPSGSSAASEIGLAASTTIVSEGFEGAFPNTLWTPASTGPFWDDVSCFAMEGTWAAWPADSGPGSVDVCSGATYPNNLDSRLIYGPFSLADAQSASLDFFFRIESESCCDQLQWLASSDGINFDGFGISGTYTGGPSFRDNFFANGYNFVSFDLTNVPNQGNLTGDSSVWIAFRFISDFSITGRGPFIDSITLRKNTDPRSYVTNENFDVFNFPNQFWENLDSDGLTNGDYRWDDEFCFAHSDGWSVWPAGDGANALDPCVGTLYPNGALSWFIHGPFSLTGANEAWVDFYFRNRSELVFDRFWWLASVDNSDFWGYFVSGDYALGSAGNGYNLIRFDLKNVPGLGDLRGQSQVWLAFFFISDGSITDQGPFVDDVSVVVERPTNISLFLPTIFKAPSPPQTILSVKNQTGGNLIFFRVSGTPQGTIQCNNIPNGATVTCGTFDSGSYTATARPTNCNENTKSKYFPPGNYLVTVTCTSSN
jgi:hypothetical protein